MSLRNDVKIGVFHPGTQHSWQTALAFQDASALEWYATSVFFLKNRFPYNLAFYLPRYIRNKVLARLRRRMHPDLDESLVKTFGMHEWLETLARSVSANGIASAIDRTGNDVFGKTVVNKLVTNKTTHIWGYNNSSVTAFRAAKKIDVQCVLDQTIGPPDSIGKFVK